MSLDNSGTVVSTLAAIAAWGAWYYASKTSSAQIQSTAIASLFTIIRELREAETQLTRAANGDADDWVRAFNDYANLLEVICGLDNDNALERTTKRLLRDHLVKDLAILANEPATRKLLCDAVDSAETFAEIRNFMQRNRLQIDAAMRRSAADRGDNECERRASA